MKNTFFEVLYVWVINLFLGQARFDKEYNAKIGAWLDENKDIVVLEHTSIINGFEIWTSNYPYSYGYPYTSFDTFDSHKKFGLSARNIVRLDHRIRGIKALRSEFKLKSEKHQLIKKMERLK